MKKYSLCWVRCNLGTFSSLRRARLQLLHACATAPPSSLVVCTYLAAAQAAPYAARTFHLHLHMYGLSVSFLCFCFRVVYTYVNPNKRGTQKVNSTHSTPPPPPTSRLSFLLVTNQSTTPRVLEQIANFLCNGNYAVSGSSKACDVVEQIAKPDFKARMTVRLAVAGAFHTDFMEAAVDKV